MLQSSPFEMLACILATPLGLFLFLLTFKRCLLTAYLVNYITLKFRLSMTRQREWNLNNRIQLGIFVFAWNKNIVCEWNFMDVYQGKVNVFFAVHYTYIYILIHSLHCLPSWQKDIYKMSWRCLFKKRKTSCQDIVRMSKRCLIVDDVQVSYQKMSCRSFVGNALNMFYIISQYFS